MTRGLAAAKDFSDIANAIRAINGLDVRYKPREMADAIRGLGEELEAGPKAILYDDGTLEFTNKAVPVYLGKGGMEEHYDLTLETYGAENPPPWSGLGERVRKIAFDSSFEQVELIALDYWCHGLTGLTEISGFDHLTHLASANHAFDGCDSLETIYAKAGFALSGIPSEGIFDGARWIVGGLRYVVGEEDGAAQLKHGEDGLLTDPANDTRHWVYLHCYEDGELVLTAEATPRGDSACLCSQHLCIDANYPVNLPKKFQTDYGDVVEHVTIDESMDGIETDISLDNMFASAPNLTGVDGWQYLHRVKTTFSCFAFCTGLIEVDISGLDPSNLHHVENFFFKCSNLTKIYADPTWELPETAYGTGVFYEDYQLTGGMGTPYTHEVNDVRYLCIDRPGQQGWLTAKETS